MLGINVGESVALAGTWVAHSQYGRQFKAESVQTCAARDGGRHRALSGQRADQGHRPDDGETDRAQVRRRDAHRHRAGARATAGRTGGRAQTGGHDRPGLGRAAEDQGSHAVPAKPQRIDRLGSSHLQALRRRRGRRGARRPVPAGAGGLRDRLPDGRQDRPGAGHRAGCAGAGRRGRCLRPQRGSRRGKYVPAREGADQAGGRAAGGHGGEGRRRHPDAARRRAGVGRGRDARRWPVAPTSARPAHPSPALAEERPVYLLPFYYGEVGVTGRLRRLADTPADRLACIRGLQLGRRVRPACGRDVRPPGADAEADGGGAGGTDPACGGADRRAGHGQDDCVAEHHPPGGVCRRADRARRRRPAGRRSGLPRRRAGRRRPSTACWSSSPPKA